MSLGFHVNLRLPSNGVLAPRAVDQRRLARAAFSTLRPFELLAFSAADTHAHALFAGERPQVVEGVRRLRITLFKAMAYPEPLRDPWFEPVNTQQHLERSFRYVLDQAAHHGYAHDPYHEASNLPDLLGLRFVGAWTREVVTARAPRWRDVDLRSLLGDDFPAVDELPPLEDDALPVLADAAAAALCIPNLSGSTPDAIVARRAAALATELPTRRVADALQLPMRTVQRLRHETVEPAIVAAVRGQALLRTTLELDVRPTSPRSAALLAARSGT